MATLKALTVELMMAELYGLPRQNRRGYRGRIKVSLTWPRHGQIGEVTMAKSKTF